MIFGVGILVGDGLSRQRLSEKKLPELLYILSKQF